METRGRDGVAGRRGRPPCARRVRGVAARGVVAQSGPPVRARAPARLRRGCAVDNIAPRTPYGRSSCITPLRGRPSIRHDSSCPKGLLHRRRNRRYLYRGSPSRDGSSFGLFVCAESRPVLRESRPLAENRGLVAHRGSARATILRGAPGRGHRVDNVLGVGATARNSWTSPLPALAPRPYGSSCPKGRPNRKRGRRNWR